MLVHVKWNRNRTLNNFKRNCCRFVSG